MSGRTFGIQSSWDDVFKSLGLDVSKTSLRKASSIADSINQQIEEHINRYVVSSTNDQGSLVFDAAGTYTFAGSVLIEGDLTLDGGIFRTSTDGQRVEIDSTTLDFVSEPAGTWFGLRLSTGDPQEFSPAVVGVGDVIAPTVGGELILKPPTAVSSVDGTEMPAPFIYLMGDATDGLPGGFVGIYEATAVYIDGSGGGALDVNGIASVVQLRASSDVLSAGLVHSGSSTSTSVGGYMEYQADGGAGIDGDGLRFVINGTAAAKIGFKDNDTTLPMLRWAETNDGISYDNTAETLDIWLNSVSELQITETAFIVPNVYSNTTADAVNINVFTNGSIRRSTSTWDIKESIQLLSEYDPQLLADYRHLMPVYFDSKVDDYKPHLGFVHEWSTGLLAGNPENKGVDLNAYMALTVAKVQEIEQRVEAVETAIIAA